MSRWYHPVLLLAVALCLPVPLAAQQYGTAADGGASPRPLNLSLPRDAMPPPGQARHEEATGRENMPAPSRTEKAEGGSESGPRNRGRDIDSPYGTGFEARQRAYGGRGFGGGGQGGYRGGRGAGRRR